MKAEIDLKTAICNAAFLAESFGVSTRNISYWIERGLPTLSHGKPGRGHAFKTPCAIHWVCGMEACKKWDIPLPPTLETMLVGYGLDIGDSFSEWYEMARKLAHDGGFTDTQFDQAMTFVLSNGLIRGRRRH